MLSDNHVAVSRVSMLLERFGSASFLCLGCFDVLGGDSRTLRRQLESPDLPQPRSNVGQELRKCERNRCPRSNGAKGFTSDPKHPKSSPRTSLESGLRYALGAEEKRLLELFADVVGFDSAPTACGPLPSRPGSRYRRDSAALQPCCSSSPSPRGGTQVTARAKLQRTTKTFNALPH